MKEHNPEYVKYVVECKAFNRKMMTIQRKKLACDKIKSVTSNNRG